jgi:hypothetical protein
VPWRDTIILSSIQEVLDNLLATKRSQTILMVGIGQVPMKPCKACRAQQRARLAQAAWLPRSPGKAIPLLLLLLLLLPAAHLHERSQGVPARHLLVIGHNDGHHALKLIGGPNYFLGKTASPVGSTATICSRTSITQMQEGKYTHTHTHSVSHTHTQSGTTQIQHPYNHAPTHFVFYLFLC